MHRCNGTVAAADSRHAFWDAIDPIAVFALIAACTVIIIAVCLIGCYVIWRLRRQFARREPARLTYYSALHSSYRRRASSPIMAFDNGGYFQRQTELEYLNGIQKKCQERSVRGLPATISKEQSLVQQPSVQITAGKKFGECASYAEGPPAAEERAARMTTRSVSADNLTHSPWTDDDEENTYEELPADYDDSTCTTIGRHDHLYANTPEMHDDIEQRQQHHQQHQHQHQQPLYENFSGITIEDYYTEPVPMIRNCTPNLSTRTFSTDTTDFEPEEKVLGTHANVTVISLSELSVDIRSCPDTPLFNRKSQKQSLPGANPSQHYNLMSGSNPVSYSESCLGYTSDHYPSLTQAEADSNNSSQRMRTEQRSGQVDRSWEMRTSF